MADRGAKTKTRPHPGSNAQYLMSFGIKRPDRPLDAYLLAAFVRGGEKSSAPGERQRAEHFLKMQAAYAGKSVAAPSGRIRRVFSVVAAHLPGSGGLGLGLRIRSGRSSAVIPIPKEPLPLPGPETRARGSGLPRHDQAEAAMLGG